MRRAFDHGDGRIVLQQRARVAMARIAPLLATAVPPDESTHAVEYPPITGSYNDPGETSLRFYSPIDFFGKRELPDDRSPRYYHYEVRYRSEALYLTALDRRNLKPRLLATQLDSFAVRRVQLNAVNIEVGVSLQKSRKEFRLETLVQIPYYAN